MNRSRNVTYGLLALAIAAALPRAAWAASPRESAIAGLVRVYDSVADTVLAARDNEAVIMQAILEVERDLALAALDANDLRTAAARIGDFATEGGAAVEPIRNRLLEGGHHQNAEDTGPAAVYDEGYVLLTKKLKQEALDLAKRCAKLGESAKPDPKEVASIREALQSLSTRVLANK